MAVIEVLYVRVVFRVLLNNLASPFWILGASLPYIIHILLYYVWQNLALPLIVYWIGFLATITGKYIFIPTCQHLKCHLSFNLFLPRP